MNLLRCFLSLFWVLFAGSVLVPSATWGYDAQTRCVSIGYDVPSSSAGDYDSASVLVGNGGKMPTGPECALLAKICNFLAAERGPYRAIGSTGQVGEEWLVNNLGGQSQVYFNTSQGGRYIDQLANGIANESKVGYQSLTPSISLQISKDAELLNAGRVNGVDWHFFQSPVTGVGGPSQPLFNALQQNGFNVIIR